MQHALLIKTDQFKINLPRYFYFIVLYGTTFEPAGRFLQIMTQTFYHWMTPQCRLQAY
jgi:hypothetical protein